jgi:hypothetical protein
MNRFTNITTRFFPSSAGTIESPFHHDFVHSLQRSCRPYARTIKPGDIEKAGERNTAGLWDTQKTVICPADCPDALESFLRQTPPQQAASFPSAGSSSG